jgi:hypothetical protein
MQITFAVPAKTTSCFVIAVDRAPTDLSSVVPWRMADPHRREVAAALGSPRLSIAVHHPAHVIVSSTAPPSHQPRSALIARAAARAVAAEYGGVIDDPLTGNRITSDGIAGDGTADGWITGDRNVGDPGCSAESPDFDLADHWLGWNIGGAPDPACPHTDPRPDRRARSADRAPLTVSTRGLRRFGMPEIMLEGDACAYGHRPFPFLLAVAERLLAEHLSWLTANPSARARTICDHLRIDCASFAPADDAPRRGLTPRLDRASPRCGPMARQGRPPRRRSLRAGRGCPSSRRTPRRRSGLRACSGLRVRCGLQTRSGLRTRCGLRAHRGLRTHCRLRGRRGLAAHRLSPWMGRGDGGCRGMCWCVCPRIATARRRSGSRWDLRSASTEIRRTGCARPWGSRRMVGPGGGGGDRLCAGWTVTASISGRHEREQGGKPCEIPKWLGMPITCGGAVSHDTIAAITRDLNV